jgi:nicotinamide/nicotinate riboside kinase
MRSYRLDEKREMAMLLLKVVSYLWSSKTKSGFWVDPPEYFDKVVWKSYVKDHNHLFEDNDVNGELRENGSLDLHTHKQIDLSIQELLVWAIGVISDYLQNIE